MRMIRSPGTQSPACVQLSVVVAASESADAVARCVRSIGGGVEVIVAWGAGATVPRLRRWGLERATGEVVAFTEDSCRLGPGWIEAWRGAFKDDRVGAATGGVEHEPGGTAIDWAVFFFEYAPFLDGARARPGRLAGNNFAVRRVEALTIGDGLELCESQIPGVLTARGRGVIAVAGATAWHRRRYELREAVRDRLATGFAYGRLRAESRGRRAAVVAAGPLIAWLQAARLVMTLARSRRHLGTFLATLPLTLVLVAAWSVGEWQGALAGPARAAGSRRRGRAARRPRPASAPAASR
jgi:hypothetical protein